MIAVSNWMLLSSSLVKCAGLIRFEWLPGLCASCTISSVVSKDFNSCWTNLDASSLALWLLVFSVRRKAKPRSYVY